MKLTLISAWIQIQILWKDFFCLGGSFEIPFQRSVLKTCKYGSFTDESNELMLEDSYGYDLSYDRFDSFGSYGSKAWKTVCTISHNLLGQLLQFSFPRRRMSIGVGLAFGCPDLP